MKIPKIKKLILSGGGIKGIAIVGALQELDNNINILSTTKTIIGTSVSAYIAFFLAIGLSIHKIRVIFENINFGDFQEFDIKLLLSKYGLDEGCKFTAFVKATMNTQNINHNITFKELAEISKYHIIIVGTNVNTSKAVYFSADDTPDMQVIIALRISGCYPFAFTPIEMNGDYYADGGLASPLASELVSKKEKKNTLGIALHRGYERYKTDDLQSYGMSVISCLVDSLLDSKLCCLKHYIVISYPINSMEFNLVREEKNRMSEFGKEMAKKWLDKFINKEDLIVQ